MLRRVLDVEGLAVHAFLGFGIDCSPSSDSARRRRFAVPSRYSPPAGGCRGRVWFDGLPGSMPPDVQSCSEKENMPDAFRTEGDHTESVAADPAPRLPEKIRRRSSKPVGRNEDKPARHTSKHGERFVHARRADSARGVYEYAVTSAPASRRLCSPRCPNSAAASAMSRSPRSWPFASTTTSTRKPSSVGATWRFSMAAPRAAGGRAGWVNQHAKSASAIKESTSVIGCQSSQGQRDGSP
jgi:hypothetical protein